MTAPITAPLLAQLGADKQARKTLTRRSNAVIVGEQLDADSCDDLDCESQGCTGACERFTESELLAADLANDSNKAFKAHQAQERSAMRMQVNDKSGYL